MVLLIDNYDSFVHNLARYVRELGETTVVLRNDRTTLAEIEAVGPTHIILSPGPCTPNEAGISSDVVLTFGPRLPVLGVCLGHQSIGQAYGASIVRAKRLMHGKTDMIHHNGRGLFAGLDNPFQATRYHSLVIKPETLTDEFEGREIMAVAHRKYPLFGVQFHPESFLTHAGYEILRAFLQV